MFNCVPLSQSSGRRHKLVAIGVDRHPVEYLVIELSGKTGFADRGSRVLGFVVEDRVGVHARITAPQASSESRCRRPCRRLDRGPLMCLWKYL